MVGHLIKRLPGCIPVEVFYKCSTWRRPRTWWWDDTSCLAQHGERMGRLLVNIKIPISRRQSRVKYSPSETYMACIIRQLIHLFPANAKEKKVDEHPPEYRNTCTRVTAALFTVAMSRSVVIQVWCFYERTCLTALIALWLDYWCAFKQPLMFPAWEKCGPPPGEDYIKDSRQESTQVSHWSRVKEVRLYSSWPWTNRRRLMPIGLFYFSCGFWYLPLLTTQVNCLYSEQSYKGLCVCVCVFMCEPLSLWSHCISFYFKINLLFCWIFPFCLSDSLPGLEPTLHGFVKIFNNLL